MSGRWVSLETAFQRRVELEGMPEPAFHAFASDLISGKIRCQGYRKGITFCDEEGIYEVSPDFWRHVDPHLEDGRFVLAQYQDMDYFDGDTSRLDIDICDFHFYVNDEEQRPSTDGVTEAPKKPQRGGRPTIHNWASAAAVAAAYVAENDYPEPRTALIEAMRACFADAGSCPDTREIERFVATMYEEGRRLKSSRGRTR